MRPTDNDNKSQSLAFWLDSLEEDPIVARVQKSAAFRRLWGISFLGALDYTWAGSGPEAWRTRACHSQSVAALAAFVSTERRYTPDLKRHIVIAALLHDIGHAPLSHSVEPFFKEALGLGHHELGCMVLAGEHAMGEGLANLLRRHCDVDLIQALMNGLAADDFGGDLFSGHINIDTIDGILRSHISLTNKDSFLDPVRLASASFLEDDGESQDILDDFWRLKHCIYNDFITSEIGLLSDWYSQAYFQSEDVSLTKKELMQDEYTWKRVYPDLFKKIGAFAHDDRERELEPRESISFIRRNYIINKEKRGTARYSVEKTLVSLTST